MRNCIALLSYFEHRNIMMWDLNTFWWTHSHMRDGQTDGTTTKIEESLTFELWYPIKVITFCNKIKLGYSLSWCSSDDFWCSAASWK